MQTKKSEQTIEIPHNVFGDGTQHETQPGAPFAMTNRKARRSAASKARSADATHHNTLADKASHLLRR